MVSTGVPRLIVTQDNEFFFDAAKEGRLEIQKCSDCGLLRHPPAPSCAECLSFEWTTLVAEGTGKVHTYTIAHRPQDAAFDYPLPIALVDLPEGVRIVADVVDTPLEELGIGLEVEVVFTPHAHGEILPSVRKVAK